MARATSVLAILVANIVYSLLLLNMVRDRNNTGLSKGGKMTSANDIRDPNAIVLALIDNSADMWKLRELVGSVHRYCSRTSIHIYESLKSEEDVEEISSWENTTVHNLGLSLFSRFGSDIRVDKECDLLSRLNYDFVLIPLGLVVADGIEVAKLPTGCKEGQEQDLIARGLKRASKESHPKHSSGRLMCWLKHKDSLLSVPETVRRHVSRYTSGRMSDRASTWTGRRVALLVPTFNKIDDKMYIVDVLLPSLGATLTAQELSTFMVTIYVGYDRNDPIEKVNMEDHVHNVAIKMHLLPSVRWATAMWNILFHDAVVDGNDYYMQLGDDIRFNQPGWLSAMISELDRMHGIGMVGPGDTRWGCKMVTQAMVTRKHHEIFNWFYPPEIKDWFSDNWLQTMYLNVKRSTCLKDYTITNRSGLKERYEPCDNVHIANEAIRRHLCKLQLYLSNNK